MKGYAATEIFTEQDLTLHMAASKLVSLMPEDGRSCHKVAALIADALDLPLVRGGYGIIEHSWLVLPSGTLLDVYAPGRYPPVQLVDARTVTLPESKSYVGVE